MEGRGWGWGVRAERGLQFHSSLQHYLKSSNCIIFCAQHCNNEKGRRQSHLAMCPWSTRTMKISSSTSRSGRGSGGSRKAGDEISLPQPTQLLSVCAENRPDREAVARQWFGPGCTFLRQSYCKGVKGKQQEGEGIVK